MAKIGIPIPKGASVTPIGNSNIARRNPKTVGPPGVRGLTLESHRASLVR
jgi:hypothetical protein